MSAPKVRANTDAHRVEVDVPAAAFAAALIHIAVEYLRDSKVAKALDELAAAANLADANDATLRLCEMSRDAARDWQDTALAALIAELPEAVWPLSYPDADRLADDLRAARRAGAA